MASLLDIAPATEVVRGVTVYGISARGIANLLGRFPELRALVMGREVDAQTLIDLAPDGIAAILAAGLGSPGDHAIEAAADRLPIESQFDMLEAILRLTLPGGFGPFAERLASLAGGMTAQAAPAAASTAAPATKSPPPSSGSSKRVTRRL
jgi:hypothetical protein